MNLFVFIIMMFVLQLFYWLVGQRSSQDLKDQEDYFLAGKNVKFFPLMMTFLATLVGGGVVLGAAEEAYRFGWPVIFYPYGAAIGLILLGCGIGRKIAEYNVGTLAQLFEVVYGSTLLRKLASILSIVSMFMILVGQIIASSKFLVTLGVDNTFIFVVFWAIVIIYTAQGGLKAVISTDMVQAVVFSIGLLLCFAWILFSGQAPISTLTVGSLENVSDKLTGWLLMPLFFMIVEQDIGQRCFAGASPQIVSRAAFWSGIVMMIVLYRSCFPRDLRQIRRIGDS